MRTYVASDWHLGSQSPPQHAHLARAFLRKVYESGAQVLLNGDIFEGLFEPIEVAEAAQGPVLEAMQALQHDGRLRRILGNHDPVRGESHVVLEVPRVGQVLVAHGHAVDPWQRSPLCQLGDAVSRRLGRFGAVRGAAHVMERLAFTALGPQILKQFRRRCAAWVQREGCAMGVFGHVHNQYLVAQEPYANAGWLGPERLEYLVFEADGPRLGALRVADLAGPAF